jgi:signal transduction histidine kinase/DNA-binding response OmpR family regulator
MVRTLSAKYSVFTVVLVLWVVLVLLLFDTRREVPDPARDFLAGLILVIVSGLVTRFTVRVIARPLANLQTGMNAVRAGRLEKIRVSRTGDEIEYLGESFNQMIEALASFQGELRQQQQTLEDRIGQRTDELKRATAKALEASKAKSEFLANMSHELRTPMNGVLGMLDIALDSRLTPDQREHLVIAQRCAFSLLDLLSDLLDLAKIESGKLVIDRKPFDLPALVEESVNQYSNKAAQKGLSLILSIQPGTERRLEGDAARIRQMAGNLLSNAVKFTERGSIAVNVSGEPAGSGRCFIQIEVSDTGPGIAPEKALLIFESFTQADGSVNRKHGGTGLGLSLTRKLAELHGGSIAVETVAGKGSTFRLRLECGVDAAADGEPLAAKPAPAAQTPAPAVRTGMGTRVLIVEDNVVNQKVIAAILRKGHYRTAIAEDGAQGLTLLENSAAAVDPFSLVLMDIQMPVMDGLEATRRIRQNPDWRHLPIIAMTAHAMNEDRERCFEAGMNSYVLKPVKPAHLLQTIERFLNDGEAGSKSAPQKAASNGAGTSAQKAAIDGLFHLFVEMAPDRLSKIESAFTRQDRYALQQETRRLAAAAERIDCRSVSAVARKIETVAPHEDFSMLVEDLQALSGAIDSLRTSVQLDAATSISG